MSLRGWRGEVDRGLDYRVGCGISVSWKPECLEKTFQDQTTVKHSHTCTKVTNKEEPPMTVHTNPGNNRYDVDGSETSTNNRPTKKKKLKISVKSLRLVSILSNSDEKLWFSR